jgi:hypothetical protein
MSALARRVKRGKCAATQPMTISGRTPLARARARRANFSQSGAIRPAGHIVYLLSPIVPETQQTTTDYG